MGHQHTTGPLPGLVHRRRDRGFSLLELVVSLAIFVVLTLVIWNLVSGAGRAVRAGFAASEIDHTTRTVIERVVADLKASGSDESGVNHVTSHPITGDTSASAITFRRRIGLVGSPSDWGSPITYSLASSSGEVAGNGVDDDGDGVVDEQVLVRTQDSVSSVVADNITTAQFSRTAGEYAIEVAFTVARFGVDDDALTSRTVSATVALRNRSHD